MKPMSPESFTSQEPLKMCRKTENQNQKSRQHLEFMLEILGTILPAGTALDAYTIAEVCGCSHQTVYNIEKAALKKLRQRMRQREAMNL